MCNSAQNSPIQCSVGILTHNSEKNFRRALESVKDFAEIVISDGGSTDRTLEIAAEYGCKVIEQHAKYHPGPEAWHPITDFARERNQLLDAASNDWFFYIDSDEYVSELLLTEIRAITSQANPEHLIYEVPIANQSPDTTVTYRPWKQNHQTRFFNKTIGGRFQKVMHERYVFDRDKFTVGRLEGKWFVPYSKPDFASYSRAVNYRIGVMIAAKPLTTFPYYLRIGWYEPIKRFIGFTGRMVLMRLTYPWKVIVPLSYYRNQCYSQWVTFKIATRLYVQHLTKGNKRDSN